MLFRSQDMAGWLSNRLHHVSIFYLGFLPIRKTTSIQGCSVTTLCAHDVFFLCYIVVSDCFASAPPFFRVGLWMFLRAPFPAECIRRSNSFAAYQMDRSPISNLGWSLRYPGALEATPLLCVPFFVDFAIGQPFFPLDNGMMMREPSPTDNTARSNVLAVDSISVL